MAQMEQALTNVRPDKTSATRDQKIHCGGCYVSDLAQAEENEFGEPQADDKTLVDLITNTVAPTSWDENGGAGSISLIPASR